MSLLTDIIFVKALRSNTTLMNQLADGDVYNTAIDMPDKDVENADLPYIIVSYDGMQNDDTTKDDSYEGDTDDVQISIEVAAEHRPQLGEMMTAIRQTIRSYFAAHKGDNSDEDFALIPNSMSVSAREVQYDQDKPCYWQVLQYRCDTNID